FQAMFFSPFRWMGSSHKKAQDPQKFVYFVLFCGLFSEQFRCWRPMMGKRILLLAAATLSAGLVQARLSAETQSSVALTGQATSAEEGPMEGVIVSAKKAGS